MRPQYFKRPSPGLSLIELMVAIALGLILVAVIVQIYIGSKTTYNKQEDLSRLQENGRVALEIIGRAGRVVGFKSNPGTPTNQIFPAATPAIIGTPGGAGVSDSITIRFQGSGNGAGTPNGSVVNCLGAAIDSNAIAVNRFFIANNAAGRPGLFCDTTGVATAPGVEVVSEIEHMRFLYGVDTSGDGVADFYVPADAVSNWDQVVSMRIGLIAATPNAVNPALDAQTYNVLGNSYDPTDDRRSRRLYTMIITLRNRTP